MIERPNRETRSDRRRRERETGWSIEWQNDTKFLTLFVNPGVAFMDCVWLQSVIIRLLVLFQHRDRISEFVQANSARGNLLPEWYVVAVHDHLRTSDMRPLIKKFQEAFATYLSEETVHDLNFMANTRNALGHAYIQAGQHIDRGTQSGARLRYAPRNIKAFGEASEDDFVELEIVADMRWMEAHHTKVFRLFGVIENIATSLGVPSGMIY
ncbi:MAG: hypothetical protein OXC99_10625 [Chloroflexi bacterium]|nr:hypothetical protein [Chloroflexota bacterium]